MAEDYDLVVVGAGPGGYVAAIRASQLGLKTAVVEADKPGGVCLNWGCIPSKAIIHQAEIFDHVASLAELGVETNLEGLDYSKVHQKSRAAADKLSKGVQFLLKKNKVTLKQGYARLSGAHEVSLDSGEALQAKHILLATGSRPTQIPAFAFDEERVLSSTGMLGLKELPRKMLILGAGAIGVEFAYILNLFGVEVELVEMMDRILPLEDQETVEILAKALKQRGVTIRLGTRAVAMEQKAQQIEVLLDEGSSQVTVTADKILVAVGRTPNTDDIGLERIGLETQKGFIPVGDHYCTSVPSVFAIGDVVASPLLAHVASKEGELAVEHMAGRPAAPRIDPLSIPSAVYTSPQIAGFGYTEAAAKQAGIKYRKATFPYRGNGKAMAVEQSEGLAKVLVDPDTGEILGAHIVGAEATEIIHELLLARTAELLPEDIACLVHAHPTLSEVAMEAMRAAEGWAIHV